MCAIDAFFKQIIIEISSKCQNFKPLVLCSGGPDSMVLLHLLFKHGFVPAVGHIDYSLRGADSDADRDLVINFATSNNLTVHIVKFNTKQLVGKEGKSIQLLARNLRYTQAQQWCRVFGYSHILVAHHLDDDLETALFNLGRGSGLDGLRGMLALQNNIFRPLLKFTKNQVLHYAHTYKIPYRQDASNAQLKYSRNQLRHQVLPAFKGIFSNIETKWIETKNRLIAEASLQNKVARQLLCQQRVGVVFFQKIKKNKGISEFSLAEKALLLFHLLKQLGFTYAQCHSVFTSNNGAMFYAENYTGVLNKDRLLVFPHLTAHSATLLPFWVKQNGCLITDYFTFEITLLDQPPVQVKLPPNECLIDARSLAGGLQLRTATPKEKIKLMGANNRSQLVSRAMAEAKIPNPLRPLLPVLADNNAVIWIPNAKRSSHYLVKVGQPCLHIVFTPAPNWRGLWV